MFLVYHEIDHILMFNKRKYFHFFQILWSKLITDYFSQVWVEGDGATKKDMEISISFGCVPFFSLVILCLNDLRLKYNFSKNTINSFYFVQEETNIKYWNILPFWSVRQISIKEIWKRRKAGWFERHLETENDILILQRERRKKVLTFQK